MLSQIDYLIEKSINEQVEKQKDIIYQALKKHLPDLTKENVAAYAPRISWGIPEEQYQRGKDYPKILYIDFDTPNQIKVLTLFEPEMDMNEDGWTVTGTFSQNYKVY